MEEAIEYFERMLGKEPSEYDPYASVSLDEARAMSDRSMSTDAWYDTSREARAHATALVIEERRISYYLGLLGEYQMLSKQGKL